MRIEVNKIKALSKLLKKSNLKINQLSNYYIVFPISTLNETKEIDGMELMMVNNKSGSEKKPEPLVVYQNVINKDDKASIIGFGDLMFARKFDFIMADSLNEGNLSKSDKKEIAQYDCYLINKENLLICFE